jgi:hypothetical protein
MRRAGAMLALLVARRLVRGRYHTDRHPDMSQYTAVGL